MCAFYFTIHTRAVRSRGRRSQVSNVGGVYKMRSHVTAMTGFARGGAARGRVLQHRVTTV
eukprot:scaffold74378_cov71-Phaeocystis_antarctica.AAC.5